MRSYAERASLYIGVKQGSTKHHNIINYYNTRIQPLPRGYKVQYSDNWCATFVSVILKQCSCELDIFECGAQRMLDKCSEYVISDRKKGASSDLIFYDWNTDSWCDHVGIISKTTKSSYYVIEGNKDKKVGVRVIPKKSLYIKAVVHLP